jgi:hypothetical protein
VFYQADEKLSAVIQDQKDFITNGIGVRFTPVSKKQPNTTLITEEAVEVRNLPAVEINECIHRLLDNT